MKNAFAPPGKTTTIHAGSVLVIAPHFDDEILGCGGLLAQLAESGSRIRVLFLSDSSGGDEVTENTADYAERRRAEAMAALAVLGIDELRYADLPDGRLAHHVEEAAQAISVNLLEHRPELLLSVSPLEITTDHQAAFAALHRVLSPLRAGDELEAVVEGMRILLYEVNHPGLPDVLVDVGPQLSQLEDAIRAHGSQLELHNYLEGAVGTRRFRTLSLPPEVEAAEGYRELSVGAFRTHGLAGLIRSLGGLPEINAIAEGPAVSVIVRTKDRPGLLQEALASLAASSYRRVEVVLVNDGGEDPEVPDDFPFPVVKVDLPENRGRAAAANAGVDAATGDFVSFLDDDDLVEVEHLATLTGLVGAAGVRVAYTDAAVGIYELNPEAGWTLVDRRLPYSRDFDPELLLFDNYIPFNTLIIERRLLSEVGPFDPDLEFFEDWDLLIRLSRRSPFHHYRQVTCEYRHFRSAGRQVFGERPSNRSDFRAMKARVIDRYRQHHSPEVLARVVAGLREEAVVHGEASSVRLAELTELRASRAELEDAYHRINGERESLRTAREQLLSQAYGLERRIHELENDAANYRETVDEQEIHLRKVYQEIERLNGLIAEMESTKAWRLHRIVEKLRGRNRPVDS